MATVLEKLRLAYNPKLPSILESIQELEPVAGDQLRELGGEEEQLEGEFTALRGQPVIRFKKGKREEHHPIRVGVVLSGGQAAGGHNVISGLYDALKKLNQKNQLIGFLDGPAGIVENNSKEINANELSKYRNQGGFDLLGSGRTKIETEEQLNAAEVTVQELDLDGLVVIGGDDSNTNAAVLANRFKSKGIKTSVVGVPKTIDGDLKNDFIEISFGFDTATKTYSEIIGNIMRDTLSAKKYWYFIKVMGRSASHIALECALQTHPNMTLIGEELAKKRSTLASVVSEMTDLVIARSEINKNYGIFIIPEGIIEFIPEVKALIAELNTLLADKSVQQQLDSKPSKQEKCEWIVDKLSKDSAACFTTIPIEIRGQLLLDRDPHGNVQVSKIETERLLIQMVKDELKRRGAKPKFSAQPLFLGYEGRSGLPSNFDSQYCYALGHVAALLINTKATGYICSVQNLTQPAEDWQIGGVPLISMIHLEERNGKLKPVIEKALVELNGPVFNAFTSMRQDWTLNDDYHFPGPIQFFGPTEVTETITLTLDYEKEECELWSY